MKRWEHALDRDLIEDPAAYANFVLQGLMRGAAKDRAEYYTRALGSGGAAGWLTQNEVRVLEDLDPLPGGDELFRGSQNAEPTAPAEPDPGQAPADPDEVDA
ncbi:MULTISPECIES: phage portal protein [unclassified Methylobacterium]|uniref:phage portal protein n=1 Tax=unclassified Methylobacterium TaxID=2615210 RepID=UPI0036FFED41